MTASSDKAQFYLERYVPELQECERKGIFTRKEIAAISSKRSDFEHTVNARGSRPDDYARYASHEMNLNHLRKKRCKRLGIKSNPTFDGERTVFFILDRATKKYPGDLSLWMQYIEFCKQSQANKKLAKVFTAVLRLFPRQWNLWVLAAKHYAETEGDINTARAYLQRGLRFCKSERQLYLEYAKLEMAYLAKLSARRKILGLDESRRPEPRDTDDMIALPPITAEDLGPNGNSDLSSTAVGALQQLSSAPAFSGAIPTAIFDASMKQFDNDAHLNYEFFDLVCRFDNVPAALTVIEHISQHLLGTSPTSIEAMVCDLRLQLFGTHALSPEFPSALRKALGVLKSISTTAVEEQLPRLRQEAVDALLPHLRDAQELDPDVAKVLSFTIKQQIKLLTSTADTSSLVALTEKLRNQKRESDLEILQNLVGEAGLSIVCTEE